MDGPDPVAARAKKAARANSDWRKQWGRDCHTQFLCQNQVLIICMTQDQLFYTYGQKC
jgi:hypothetical protein